MANVPAIKKNRKKDMDKPQKNKHRKRDTALLNRIKYTLLIHAMAAIIFAGIYAVPAIIHWVQHTEFRTLNGSMPIGMVLLILPTLLITFIWIGDEMGKGKVLKKIRLALWLVINVGISFGYLILIHLAFANILIAE
jgi:hypothetical protein